ncbi:VOC family protein [Planosporangium thailandense]|uniref:VOC family protein n=1 Tax=Planosporangium thailandense TaxID=765197 RepID=A0ABX0Y728_9ACTN|nr:VOC family protein [Planosporangium thailandense]
MIGRVYAVVLDCPDAESLLAFYQQVTGWQREQSANGDWLTLRGDNGMRLAFQEVPDYQSPRWPGAGCPQQLHLDVMVDDLDVAEPQVLALGATLLEGSDKPVGWRVYADPAGHPFCLTTN